jgi:hypothetical protein
MMRMLRTLAVVPLLAVVLTGCTKQSERRDVVLAAIDGTAAVARSFDYAASDGRQRIDVRGSIADDVTYRLDATAAGRPLASLVVVDDAEALRVADPALVTTLEHAGPGPAPVAGAGAATPAAGGATPAPASAGAAASAADQAGTEAALRAGGWVIDRSGARTVTAVPATESARDDPLYDALDVLSYTRKAVSESSLVVDFNPESPYYQPRLDTFPRPATGEHRYDVLGPGLPPKAADTVAGVLNAGNAPHTPYFRRMSVYVRNGMVSRIEESISITSRLLDPSSQLQDRLQDYGVSTAAGASPAVQAVALKNKLAAAGVVIPEGTTSVRFSGLGIAAPVSLPTGATAGTLQHIANHGQVLVEATLKESTT